MSYKQILEKLERDKQNRQKIIVVFGIIVGIIILAGLLLNILILHQRDNHLEQQSYEETVRNAQIANILIFDEFGKLDVYTHMVEHFPTAFNSNIKSRFQKYINHAESKATGIGIIRPNGTGMMFYKGQKQPTDIDARGKDYYILGMKNKRTVTAYGGNSKYNKDNLLLYTSPVTSNGKVLGLLICDVNLNHITNQLKQHGTKTYFINNNGDFIFKETGLIYHNIHQLNYDKGYKMPESIVTRAINTQKPFTYKGKFEGKKAIITFAPLDYNNWKLMTVTPLIHNKMGIGLMHLIILLSLLIDACLIGATFYIFISKDRSNNLMMSLFTHDSITGCLNRLHFIINYNKFLDKLKKNDPRSFALIVMDIDKFKTVNMVSGFEGGNKILKEIFNVVENSMDKDCICCKYRDDQYAMFYPYYKKDDLILICEEIEKGISEIKSIVKLIPSFGIYQYKEKDYTNPISDISRKAELAKNQAKGIITGRKKYAFYSEDLEQDILKEKEIEDSIGDAIKNEEIKIYLQACYVLKTGKRFMNRTIFEWQSEKFGIIPEEKFIPMFENNGYALEFDKYAFTKLSVTVRNMLNDNLPLLPVSRPLSKFHFNFENFANELAHIINKYNVPRELVQVEIPPEAIKEDQTAVIKTVEQLHNKGYKVSLNNYGYGNSPYEILIKSPLDMVTIDHICLEKSLEDSKTRELLKQLIYLIHVLGAQAMITDIATKEEADLALELDCDFGCGDYFAERFDIDYYPKNVELWHHIFDYDYRNRYLPEDKKFSEDKLKNS